MARKCKTYSSDNTPCSGSGSGGFESSVGGGIGVTCSEYRDTSNLDNSGCYGLISDDKRNGRGRGINRRKDTKCFCDSLVEYVTVTTRGASGDKAVTLTVNKNLRDEIIDIFKDLYYEAPNFKILTVYCYSYRDAVGSTGNLSSHAYGMAIDINASHNPYENGYENRCDVSGCKGPDHNNNEDLHIRNENHKCVQIFKRHNWGWGGNFSNKKDYMHFSRDGH